MDALYNLGLAQSRRGDLAAALASLQRAVTASPEHARAHYHIGNLLRKQNHWEGAVESYQRAAVLNPGHAQAHNNLGNVLHEMGRLEEAKASLKQAIAAQSDYAEAHYNLGMVLEDEGELTEALEYYNLALLADPKYAMAQFNRATTLLLMGAWHEGWLAYEWRWRTSLKRVTFEQPLWTGQPLTGKRVLLCAEQGLGDTLQFVRFASLVKQRCEQVIVMAQDPLRRMLASCPDVDDVVGPGDESPSFDVHAPLMSLPGVLDTTVETIPADVPYLHPDSGLVNRWRDRLAMGDGFRVGIGWQGNPTYRGDRYRSMALKHFVRMAPVAGVHWISLQKGPGKEQLTDLIRENEHPDMRILDLGDDVDEEAGAFMDTAAIMKCLDLVITSDSAIAHLAGALAVPVWVALPFMPDWRWLLDREDSPWYPTMRLFRQKTPGDWEAVFSEIRKSLELEVKGQSRK